MTRDEWRLQILDAAIVKLFAKQRRVVEELARLSHERLALRAKIEDRRAEPEHEERANETCA